MPRSTKEHIRVLVADDEATLRLLLEAELSLAEDVEIVGQCIDGIDAVESALNLKPDVVIMDIRMPRLSGIEATQRITSILPETKVVMLTNSPDERHERMSLDAGAATYLEKLAYVNLIADVVRDVHAGRPARATTR